MNNKEQKLENKHLTANDANVPVMRRIFSDAQYEWMLRNFPFKLMYRKVPFDGAYIWKPKWGWTKRQIADAENKADELMKGLKWE
jgi:hypothetical protein